VATPSSINAAQTINDNHHSDSTQNAVGDPTNIMAKKWSRLAGRARSPYLG